MYNTNNIWSDKEPFQKNFLKFNYSMYENGKVLNKSFSVPCKTPWFGKDKRVAGISFRNEYNISSNDVGKVLKAIPDPTNPYDKFAVKLEFDGQDMGFVPRKNDNNAKVFALLDQGYDLEIRISDVSGGCPELENSKNVEEFLVNFYDLYPFQFETVIGPINSTKDIKEQAKKYVKDEVSIELYNMIKNKKFSDFKKKTKCENIKNIGVGFQIFVNYEPLKEEVHNVNEKTLNDTEENKRTISDAVKKIDESSKYMDQRRNILKENELEMYDQKGEQEYVFNSTRKSRKKLLD